MGGDCSFHALIAYPQDERVLVSTLRDDQYLPYVASEEYTIHCKPICSLVQEELSLSFSFRLLRKECRVKEGGGFPAKLIMFEVLSPVVPKPPSGFSWVGREKIDGVKVSPHVEIVTLYLRKYLRDGLRVHWERLWPYSKPGWFQEASSWMKSSLERYGCNCVRTLEHISQSAQSSMLRAETENGLFYMKAASPSGLNNEALISSSLSEILPEYFVKPVRVDDKRRWIVMQDYGPTYPRLSELVEEDPDVCRRILTVWGRVQLQSVDLKGELTETGCPEISTSWITEQVQRMVGDPEWFSAQDDTLKELGRARYGMAEYGRKYLQHVQKVCEELKNYNVPLALVHGDMDPSNIAKSVEGEYRFLDFGFTCISFPFLDALNLWGFPSVDLEFDGLDFYLEMWTAYEPLPRLRELLIVVDQFLDVLLALRGYQLFRNEEEGGLEKSRELVGLPISRCFDE